LNKNRKNQIEQKNNSIKNKMLDNQRVRVATTVHKQANDQVKRQNGAMSSKKLIQKYAACVELGVPGIEGV
jgi:phosphohistidine swiveling domain-containing protein